MKKDEKSDYWLLPADAGSKFRERSVHWILSPQGCWRWSRASGFPCDVQVKRRSRVGFKRKSLKFPGKASYFSTCLFSRDNKFRPFLRKFAKRMRGFLVCDAARNF